MLLNYRQLGACVSLTAVFSLGLPVWAGGNLSISPDQKTAVPPTQIKNNDDVVSDKTAGNAELTDVPSTSNTIIEIPVRIDSDGAVDGSRFGSPPSYGESWDGNSIDKLFVVCVINLSAKEGAGEDAQRAANMGGGFFGNSKKKEIYLDSEGDFEGTVKFGYNLDFDSLNYSYRCSLNYPQTTGISASANGTSISDDGAGFSTLVNGDIPEPGQ